MLEIIERDGADRHADAQRQSDRRALVAHIGTVRQIVGAIHPRHQRIHVGAFERAAAGTVENYRLGSNCRSSAPIWRIASAHAIGSYLSVGAFHRSGCVNLPCSSSA